MVFALIFRTLALNLIRDYSMNKLFFILVLGMCPLFVEAQTLTVRFDGAITNVDSGKKEPSVNVAIVQNNQKVSNVVTDTKGKYTLKGSINTNKPFEVVFAKNGMVSKKILFDFKGIPVESLPAGDFSPIDALNLDLFNERPNTDFSFLETEPVGKFVWDTKSGPKLDEAIRKATADKINKKLQEAQSKEKEQQKNELAYNDAIKIADKAYAEKKYQLALDNYEKAVIIPGKGKEKYPNDRILEISTIIQKQKEQQLQFEQQNSEYTNLIQAADNLRNSGELQKAKQKYSEAQQLKKDEKYPAEQIKWIDQQLANKQSNQQYNDIIEQGDKLAKQKDYAAAIEKYQQATKLKPNENYPKGKIQELELIVKNEQKATAIKQKYDQFIQQGDKFAQEQKWNEAQNAYQQASAIQKTPYVQEKLQEIGKKISSEKSDEERTAKVKQLIQAGDNAQTQKQWSVAIAKYKEALIFDPNNAIITQKINEATQKQTTETESKNTESQFNTIVKQADQALSIRKYQEAIDKYNEALKIKDDPSVKQKKEQAQQTLQQLYKNKETQTEYNKFVEQGKKATLEKNYTLAIEKYQNALSIKPNDPTATNKIKELNKIIEEQQTNALKQQEKQEREQKIISLLKEGDKLMAGNTLDAPQLNLAKEKFKEVIAIDNKNSTAIQRIAQIDKLIEQQNELTQKNIQFEQLVTQGDQKQNEQQYTEALQLYDSALKIKNDANVQAKKTNAQQKLIEQRAQNKLKSQYQTAVQIADKFRDSKKYIEAIAQYEAAKKIDPQQNYPQQEIEKINDLIAKKKIEENNNKYITQQLYRAKVAFEQKKYNESIAIYREILAIDPNHAKAKTELALVEDEKAKQEEQALLSIKFNELKAKGITYANNKKWSEAKQAFQDALSLKKDAEVSRRLADVNQAIYDEEQAKIIDQQYNELIKHAQQAETQQSYDEAIELYKKASELKPSKQILNKIYEVRSTYQELKYQWELDDRFDKFMAKGNWMNENDQYPQAIQNYKDALEVKPAHPEAKKKLAEVQQKLALQKQKEEDAAIQKIVTEINKQINDKDFYGGRKNVQKALMIRPKDPQIIALYTHLESVERNTYLFEEYMEKATMFENLRNYGEALNFYQQAKEVKPEANLDVKIQEMQQFIEQQKYIAQQNKLFNQYSVAAQQHQARAEYENALTNYKKAQEVFPDDAETQMKIVEVQTKINKIEAERKQREEEDVAFNNLVQQADTYYNNKDYEQSLKLFREANAQRPDNVYVRSKLAEVDKSYRIEAKELFEQNYQKIIANADNAYQNKEYQQALQEYQKASELKIDALYPKARINELNGILNPTLDTSHELKDLGEPFDGTILDGELALMKAEAQREDSRRAKIKQVTQKVDITNQEIEANKQKELDTRLQSLYDVYMYMNETQHFRVSDKLTSFADLRDKTNKQIELHIANSNEQTQSTFDTQKQINQQNEKVATIFDGKEIEPIENRATIELVNAENQDSERKRAEIKQFENRVRDGGLTLLKNQQEDIEVVTTNEQKQVADRVERQRTRADIQTDEQTVQNYHDVLTIKQQAQQVQSTVEDNKTPIIDQRERSETINNIRVKEDELTIERIQVKKNDIENVDNNLAEMLKIKDEKEYVDATNQGRIERILVAKDVSRTREQIEDLTNVLTDQNLQKVMSAKQHTEHVNFTLEEIGNANVEALSENNQKFREREQTLIDKQRYDMDKDYQESVDAEIKMREIRKKVVENQLTSEANLIERIQTVETTKNELSESELQLIQKNAGKHNDAKDILDKQEIKKQQIENDALLALNEKVTSINIATASAVNTYEKIGDATYDEQLQIQSQMNIEKDSRTTKFNQKEAESQQKSEEMKELSKALSIDNIAKEAEKTNVIHATRTEIAKATNYTAQTTYIPNSLGEKYPEGVSQEMYQRKDDAGVLVAIVTRRIVVIQGRGTEYVCTRTNHATTYTKNGSPITEYIWQKETQDASLERHY